MTLDSGVTLLYQRNHLSDTNALGIWITHGSRDEAPSERGLSHLLEHMVFRGTRRRDALQIALDLEAIGGQWDAFTGKETTSFNAKILAEHFEEIVDIYSDLLLFPTIPAEVFKLERSVVQEEIRGIKDSPEDYTHELFMAALFKGHPLGFPVAGTESQIGRFGREDLLEFHRRVYSARNTVICYIGNLPLSKVSRTIEEKFRFRRKRRSAASAAVQGRGARTARRHRPDWAQTHVCIGTRTVSASHPDRYALALLANILGGGVSSRLFQKMREERGLVYSVFTHSGFWRDTGSLISFFSVDPRNLRAAYDIFLGEIDDLRAGNIGARELDSAKAQLKASVIFGSESVISRLFGLFHSYHHHKRYIGVPEMVESIERVGIEEIAVAAEAFLDREALTVTSCGPKTL